MKMTKEEYEEAKRLFVVMWMTRAKKTEPDDDDCKNLQKMGGGAPPVSWPKGWPRWTFP